MPAALLNISQNKHFAGQFNAAANTGAFLQKGTQASFQTLEKKYAAKLSVLRFVAICSIVWGHSLLGWETHQFQSTGAQLVQSVVMQCGRVGTVIFFIISGFFMANKIDKFNVGGYLLYRLNSIIIPWVIFVLLCVCLQVFQIFSFSDLVNLPSNTTLPVVKLLLTSSVFYAAYWFIPVSIISACLLVLAKKYSRAMWLGGVLAVITLFYCINLYYGWIDTNHTKSFLGYTFFMWVGVALKNNLYKVDRFIKRIKWQYIIVAFIIAFAASCIETSYLRQAGCKDPYASNRFFNIILSAIVFTSFVKYRSIYNVKKLRPEKYVYGVYLIHSLVLIEVMPPFMRDLKELGITANAPILLAIQFSFFAFIIFSSYLLSMAIKKSRLRFLTGRM